jgi:RecB family exonuclease
MNAPAELGTVRASSWPTLFDCSLRWYYQNVVGLRLPSSGYAQLGTALHKSTAVYDTPTLTGESGSISDACDALAETIAKPTADVQWDDDLRQEAAIDIGVALTKRYAAEIAPTHTYRAVEVRCDDMRIATADGVVRITGVTDRVRVTEDGREGIADLKSGKTAVSAEGKANTKGHHLQTGIYRLMAENALQRPLDAPDEIIGLQTGKTEKAQRVAAAEIRDSRTPLVGDGDAPGLIEMAARMLRTGLFPPNPKSTLCSPKYCAGFPRCKFHD